MIIANINVENAKAINDNGTEAFTQENYDGDKKYPFKWTLIGAFVFCAIFWALVFYFFNN